MLRLVNDQADAGDTIPFPTHRVAPRGRLVGPADDAQRTLEDAQAQLDQIKNLLDFEFYRSEDDGPKAA